MIETALIIEAMLIPIMSILFFVLGYNMNASKKIVFKPRKAKKNEVEQLLEKIDNAHIRGK